MIWQRAATTLVFVGKRQVSSVKKKVQALWEGSSSSPGIHQMDIDSSVSGKVIDYVTAKPRSRSYFEGDRSTYNNIDYEMSLARS